MHDPTQDDDGDQTQTINVVPLADLTLVLLVILMVLSPMISQSMIHVAAPAVKADKDITPQDPSSDEKAPDPLMISVSKGGYALNNVPAETMEQLVNGVAARLAEDPQRQVLVSADDDVIVDAVVRVLDEVKLKEPEIAAALGLASFTIKMSLLKRAEPQ